MRRNLTSANRTRLLLALAIGCGTAAISYWGWASKRSLPSDFAQIWTAARALLSGENPYAAVGPGRMFDWPFPLLYPGPAILVGLPFAWMPLRVADAVFAGLGLGTLAWGLTSRGLWHPSLLVFLSIAAHAAAHTSQWSPLLTAGALVPWLSPLWIAKPTIGLALFAAYPNRTALIGAGVLSILSLVLMPTWPLQWIESAQSAPHVRPAILQAWVGPLLLLGLFRWRDPDVRLLLGLACVPLTLNFYEVLPLCLAIRTLPEGLAFIGMLLVTHAWVGSAPFPSWAAFYETIGEAMVWCVFIPSLAWLLVRRNAHPVTHGEGA